MQVGAAQTSASATGCVFTVEPPMSRAQEGDWQGPGAIRPSPDPCCSPAPMSLLMSEIMRSHSPLPGGLVVRAARGPVPRLRWRWRWSQPGGTLPVVQDDPTPSFTPMAPRSSSKCWLSFSGMKGRRPADTRPT